MEAVVIGAAVVALVIFALMRGRRTSTERHDQGSESPAAPVEARQAYGALQREATARKDARDLDGAIRKVRQAIAQEGRDCVANDTKGRVRLPKLLQQAGRGEDAWRDFLAILDETSRVPKRMRSAVLVTVFDAMRLFMQREGRPAAAVVPGALSHVEQAISVDGGRIEREDLIGELTKYLKKARAVDRVATLADIVEGHLRVPRQVDREALVRDLEAALELEPSEPYRVPTYW